MIRKWVYITGLFLLFVSRVPAQEGETDLYLKQVDLPSDFEAVAIRAMHTDSSGFLWLGTNLGLYRWDGQFALPVSYGPGEQSSAVSAIAEGDDGRIWAGCLDGSIFYVEQRNGTRWRPPDTSRNSSINDLLIDSKGRLWWGTNGSGIYCFDGQQVIHITTEAGLPDNYIYNLAEGDDQKIYASSDNGLAVVRGNDPLNGIRSFGIRDGLRDKIVRSVQKDEQGRLWLGLHSGGVCRFNPGNNSFEYIGGFDFGTIEHLKISGNSVWITDSRHGLVRLPMDDLTAPAKVRIAGDYFDRYIRLTHADEQGNLWVLGNEALYVSSGGAFARLTSYEDEDLRRAQAFAIGPEGGMLLADGGSIKLLKGGRSSMIYSGLLPPNANITDLQVDGQGLIWIATFGQGIVLLDPSTNKLRTIKQENEGLINNGVLDISIREGSIWAATLGGASHILISGNRLKDEIRIDSYDNERGLSNNFIYQVLQDRMGNIWFATDGNGLARLEGEDFTFYDESSGLGDDVVYSMDEDKYGNIWLSTSSMGIYCFKKGVFIHYPMFMTSEVGDIFSLACLGGYLCVLTESGLFVVDIENDIIVGLNEELGLRRVNADLNCAYKRGSNIYFQTRQGVLKVDTERLPSFGLKPLTVIDRIMVNLKPFPTLDHVRLAPSQNQLVIEYTGHWFLAPEKVRYNIRLNGYDPDWQTTYDRRTSYASLPDGNYSLQLASFIDPGQTSTLRQSVSFTILKPFYQRLWFIIIAVLMVFSGVFVYVRFREKRLRLIEARKKEKLEFEFQTLKNQINPHFLFNSFSTLISMIEEEPKQAVSYADRLSDFFRNILDVKDKELITLDEELQMMRNYFFIQKKRFGENLSMEIDLQSQVMQTRIPPLTLQLLVENAIKHNIISRSKPLQVRIYDEEDSLVVQNILQPKKDIEPSTGIGLKNIRERYRLIGGKTITIFSDDSTFTVVLPLLK